MPKRVGSQIARHGLAGPELVLRVGVGPEPEHVGVELARPLTVLRRNRDEVDLADLHQGIVPSENGA
jgi:hypothetical protein